MGSKVGLKQNYNIGHLLKRYNAVVVLVVLVILNCLFTTKFLRVDTIWNLAIQCTTVALLSMGMIMVISTGGIDISVGSMMALAGMITAKLLPVMGIGGAALVAVIVCGLCGLFTGYIIAVFRLQPIVITLSMMMMLRGLAQIMNDGMLITFQDDGFNAIGTAKFFGVVPVQLVYILVALAIIWFVMSKTCYGLQVQGVGENEKAATLVGIRVTGIIMSVYVFAAIFAAFAGIIETAKMSAADGNSLGKLCELDAIAAVAISGTSMNGGRAMVVGAFIGAMVMELISISVNMNNISDAIAQIAKALIIIVAIVIQRDGKN